MLSAHKAGEGPILVAGSSDIRLETDLPDPTAARLGQRVTLIGPEIGIDEFAAAAKSTVREALSHLGSRFHSIYCAI
jgi:alanine racemase